jgi:plastocyanin
MNGMGRARWPIVAALALVAGVSVAPPGPAAEGTAVQMVDNEPDLTNWHFDPKQLTVAVGSTVLWHNRGHEDHSITADDKSFDSGLKKPGTDFQRAFPRVGKYAYHCTPHPWMTGVIQVVAASAAADSAPTAPAPAATAPGATATTRVAAATTTLPPALATQAPGRAPETTSTQAPEVTTGPPSKGSGDSAAAPAGTGGHSGGNLVGTLAIVLIPTLGALAFGAKVRRSRS